ncbi:MAG: hypothetical protein WC307_05245 [Candidatus Nanoarchaeia archaeon]|jgi:hypothetical protein
MKEVKIGNLGRVLMLNLLLKIEKTGSSILAIKQIRELIPKIAFTEEEKESMSITEEEGKGIKWMGDKELSYELNDSLYGAVKKELIMINESSKVNFQMLDFIEKVLTVDDFNKLIEEKK